MGSDPNYITHTLYCIILLIFDSIIFVLQIIESGIYANI